MHCLVSAMLGMLAAIAITAEAKQFTSYGVDPTSVSVIPNGVHSSQSFGNCPGTNKCRAGVARQIYFVFWQAQ